MPAALTEFYQLDSQVFTNAVEFFLDKLCFRCVEFLRLVRLSVVFDDEQTGKLKHIAGRKTKTDEKA